MSAALDEYDALVAKVDAAVAHIAEARRRDLACRAGCDGCCRVELSVSEVEAASIRRHLATLADDERRALGAWARLPARGGPRCAFLDEEGRCGVYAARPLVCRTQGLPLRYPDGVGWCSLNFTARLPAPADFLDAGRVDELLALVNHRHAVENGRDPLARVALRDLATAP